MRKIDEVISVSNQGVSRPYICRDDGGGMRWCKGNHTGIRAVICEWICANIARALNLPVPDFAIFKLIYEDFNGWRCNYGKDNAPDLVTSANPYVFGSLNVDNVKDVYDPQLELRHIDANVLAKIYMFDRLIRNTDRTDVNSNLLVNGSVYIIDHNNAFDLEFNDDVFAKEHILRDYFRAATDEFKVKFLEQIEREITSELIFRKWSEMPDVWMEIGEEILPPETIIKTLGCRY